MRVWVISWVDNSRRDGGGVCGVYSDSTTALLSRKGEWMKLGNGYIMNDGDNTFTLNEYTVIHPH